MKNNRNKIFALFACMVFCLVFSGCAKITYSFINSDDYILQQVKIELDAENIESHNANLVEIKNSVEEKIQSYSDGTRSEFLHYLLTYGALGEDEQKLAMAIQTAVKTECFWHGNTIVYNVKFSPVISSGLYCSKENVYYFYYTGKFTAPQDDESIQSETTDELFVSIYKETYTTSFDNKAMEDALLSEYSTYGFTLSDVAYVYRYGQVYSRVHSDADRVNKVDGVYIHSWDLENCDDSITLYRVTARPVAWFVLALICGFITAITIIVVTKLKKLNKK